MSIYINGMEMPRSCFYCPFQHKNTTECLITHKYYNWGLTTPPSDCPIIPVPPHGRLINADARVNVQMYNDEFEDFQTVNMSIDDLLDSSWIELEDDPTIIPANKKTEHE